MVSQLLQEFELLAMDRCLELAARGRGEVEPNPLVGAVLLRDEEIRAEGWHQHFGCEHAEVNCLSGRSDELVRGATLVVNLEPCSHHGKTPPCADLLIQRGIARVIVGMQDPNPLVAGQGLTRLQEAGIEVLCGVREQECRRLNRNFITAQLEGRPRVTLKWAQSLDGRVSRSRTEPTSISCEASNRAVHQLRTEHPAILVGLRTVRVDNPLLNVRHVEGPTPTPCVLDPLLRIPLMSSLVASAYNQGLFVYHSSPQKTARLNALRERHVICIETPCVDGQLDLAFVLRDLLLHGRNGLLVEGGPYTHNRFLEAGLVDEVVCITSPQVFGTGPRALDRVNAASEMKLLDVTQVGEDCWMRLEPKE